MTETYQSQIEKAGALLDSGKHELCLSLMKRTWLANPNETEIISLFSRYAKSLKQEELSAALDHLYEKTKSGGSKLDQHPQELFEAAYHLVSARHFEIGRNLLERCLSKVPANITVRYELAFAQMSLGDYTNAVNNFEQVLKLEEDFDTVLNLSACYSLLRDIKNVESSIKKLEKLVSEEEEKFEVEHRKLVLQRLNFMAKKKQFTKQDWFFVLYGTILLGYKPPVKANTNVGPVVDAFNVLVPSHNYKALAGTLATLKGVLRGLEMEPEAIEYYNYLSKPMAQVEARIFDTTCDIYTGPDRPDYAVMLMNKADEIIGPHESFLENQNNRAIFAYSLNPDMPLPVTPEIIGHLGEILFPWEQDSSMLSEFDDDQTEKLLEEAMPKILEIACNMENDAEVIGTVTDTVLYYTDKRELLTIQNADIIQRRPEFTAEIHDS